MRAVLRTVTCFLVVFLLSAIAPAKEQFQWDPIPADELSYQGPPKTGPDGAVLLYRLHHVDDEQDFEIHHYRIKVLSEGGMKWADVEIPYVKGYWKVEELRARAVAPDGAVHEFNGTVFDKLVLRHRRTKVQVKTFTVPGVKVGAIIEYRYKIRGAARRTWSLQHELHTRRSSYFLRPTSGYTGGGFFSSFRVRPGLFWTYYTPDKKKLTQHENGDVSLDLAEVPAVVEESYSPPENEIRMRVDFFYSFQNFLSRPNDFWDQIAQYYWPGWERFVDKKKALQRELARITTANDTAEQKLQKIYARAQQVRNLSFEREKTEKEEKREKLKDIEHVEHVLERNYGYGIDVNLLFLGLARAAGFEASMVLLAPRNDRFFSKEIVDDRQISTHIVAVKVGNEDRYFDPATKFCAYGQLPWEETGTDGFKVGEKTATFIRTPLPTPEEALTRRVADLRLSETGDLQGSIKVEYTGLEALRRRLELRHEDEVKRREELEEELKQMLLPSAEVKLQNATGWDESGAALVAEFSVRVPEYAVTTGKRLLLDVWATGARRPQPFTVSQRVHPIYFEYPFMDAEEITLALPAGYQVENLPAPRQTERQWERFEAAYAQEGGVVRATRRLAIKGVLYPKSYYPQLRALLDGVRAADADKLVLQAAQSAKP